MDFRVLGPVTVLDGTDPVTIGGPKPRAVLAVLLSRVGEPVSVDVLVQAVYGEDAPDRSRRSVQTYVSNLRGVLGDVIVKVGNGWTLRVDPGVVDAERLAAAVGSVESVSAERLVDVLASALGEWRGDPYADVEAHGLLDAEVARLRELRVMALRRRIDALLELGRHPEVIGEIEGLIAAYPYQEHFRAQHMRALYRAGRQADALRSFAEIRELLVEELGIEPGADLRELERRILEQDESLEGGPAPQSEGAASATTVRAEPPVEPPSGTVTFMFTDVESSTRLWAEDAESMSESLQVHDDVLRSSIDHHAGYVFTTAGDAFCAAFASTSRAAACAIAVQHRMAEASWPGPELRVRIGLHVGEAEERDGDYFGPVVNLAARVSGAGHAGQILATDAVCSTAVIDSLDLGEHRLKDVPLPVRLHQVGPGSFPPPRAVSGRRSNLPDPPNPLIGRDDDVARIRSLLADNRLVTLTGPGGSGKTRLAIEVALQVVELEDCGDDGVFFVDLSIVSEDDGVASAVAEALAAGGIGGGSAAPVDETVSRRAVLVVLDNCEHVVEAAAEFAEAVVDRGGPGRLLATSREFLDIDGEQVHRVAALATAEGGPAIELFAARAAAVTPGFVVDDSNRRTVAALCEQLDGMPLAIELAAARTTVLSPAELLERIEDRFRLLSGGRRRGRRKQRTLEATIDWSFDLLDHQEQKLLLSLGVFRGSFDREAAAEVGGIGVDEATDLIEALVTKSLVVVRRGSRITWFRLLETIRAYAEDRLLREGTLESVRDRHLGCFLARTEVMAEAVRAREGIETAWGIGELTRWGPQRPNVEAAIDWALATDRHVDAGELLFRARVLWFSPTTDSVWERLEMIRAGVGTGSELAERLAILEIDYFSAIGDHHRVIRVAEGLRDASDLHARSTGLLFLASLRRFDSDEFLRLCAEGEELGVHNRFGGWATIRAEVALEQGDPRGATELLDPYVAQGSMGTAAQTMAVALLELGRPSEAYPLVAHYELLGDAFPHRLLHALCVLAEGQRERAETEIVDLARGRIADPVEHLSNRALVGLAALADVDGHREWAREIMLAVAANRLVHTFTIAAMVARRLGCFDEFRAGVDAAFDHGWRDTASEFLVATLARWDELHPLSGPKSTPAERQ